MVKASQYCQAGVDLSVSDDLVGRLLSLIGTNKAYDVGNNSFAAVLPLPSSIANPVMLTSCDGIGTKLRLLELTDQLSVAGIDLVATCTNDIICHGGIPAFFLDYYSCNKLKIQPAEQLIAGIVEGCSLVGCKLVGGETAELPDSHATDLAGFAIGFASEDSLLGYKRVRESDAVIAVASSGPHCNGFSLIRKILRNSNSNLAEKYQDKTLAEWLLAPTKIYAKVAEQLFALSGIRAIAHITGGGILDNVARILPKNLQVRLDKKQFPQSPIFTWIAKQGDIDEKEMHQVFNCGIGLVVVIDKTHVDSAIATLNNCGEQACWIGEITAGAGEVNID